MINDDDNDDNHLINANLKFWKRGRNDFSHDLWHKSGVYPLFLSCVARAQRISFLPYSIALYSK